LPGLPHAKNKFRNLLPKENVRLQISAVALKATVAAFRSEEKTRSIWAKINLKILQCSCTLPAQLCKLLKLNGAGDGNRTLVSIPHA
jgi:hypothetical protein